MSVDTIARLKISLDDAKPAVLRRVEVPFDIRLDRLHVAEVTNEIRLSATTLKRL